MEEDELRDLEVVEKVIEMGGIRMIIGEILCLFDFIACPLLLLIFKLRSKKQIEYAVTSIGVDLHSITTEIYSG